MFIPVIRTSAFLLFGIPVSVIGTPLVTVCWLVDRSGKIPHSLTRWFLSTLSYIVGIRVTVEGREHIDRKQPCLILTNHKSSADILVVARVLHLHFKFFAASFLFSIPFFGWCMSMAGYLPIDRSNRIQARKYIMKGTQKLKSGKSSLIIFPEGTRCEKPVIQDFKYGFLRISTEAQQPILPVVVDGTAEVKQKNNFWFRPGQVHVSILPLQSTSGLIREDWSETKKKYEEMFRTEYDRIHKIRMSNQNGGLK